MAMTHDVVEDLLSQEVAAPLMMLHDQLVRIADSLEVLAAPVREQAIARMERLADEIEHYSFVQPHPHGDMTEQDLRDILRRKLAEKQRLLQIYRWLKEQS